MEAHGGPPQDSQRLPQGPLDRQERHRRQGPHKGWLVQPILAVLPPINLVQACGH